jgi:hypothetical protein
MRAICYNHIIGSLTHPRATFIALATYRAAQAMKPGAGHQRWELLNV